MKKKIIAMALTVCLMCSAIPLEVVAIETTNSTEEEKDSHNTTKENSNENMLDASSAVAVTIRTVEDVVSQLKFSGNGGHGFAAEQGNNLIDKIKGNNAIVVGDDNIKNGADRIILNRDGSVTKIQDKYYSTASATIHF